MLLRNKTKTEITLPSRHVIGAGGSIEATDGVMLYPDNRLDLEMRLKSGELALEEPKAAKAKSKVSDGD